MMSPRIWVILAQADGSDIFISNANHHEALRWRANRNLFDVGNTPLQHGPAKKNA